MDAWMEMVNRLKLPEGVDPVVAAAVAAFGFVFLHPFDDGNGRIHRFLVHHILSKLGFTPQGILFPVSAAMLRDRMAYDQVLEVFSASIMSFIQYELDPEDGMTVQNATAQLYLSGIVTPTGKMVKDHPRIRIRKGHPEFVLADESQTNGPPVVFTQDDVRAVQLAKGAIRAGIDVLLEEAKITEEQLDQIIVAGAFGNYMNVASAVAIDMLPALPLDRFAQVGNAAGIGAKLALVSYPHRAKAQSIASSSHYLELAGSKRFSSAFMNAMRFPARARN